MLPTTLPPGGEWCYVICHGGPLEGRVKDVPSDFLPGTRVRWHEGV